MNDYLGPSNSTIEHKSSIRDVRVSLRTVIASSQLIWECYQKGQSNDFMDPENIRYKRSSATHDSISTSQWLYHCNYHCWIIAAMGTSSKMLINSLENIQRSFTRKIVGMDNMADKDKQTLLFSTNDDVTERYLIIYTWKIITEIVPNLCTKTKITRNHNERRGRHLILSNMRPWLKLKNLRENSFAVKGSKLFRIPKHIRDPEIKDIQKFKTCLDIYLKILLRISELEKLTISFNWHFVKVGS